MEDESPCQRTVEVAIPNVGTFVIESEEGGYDDEVALGLMNFLFLLCPMCWDACSSLMHDANASLRIDIARHWIFHTWQILTLHADWL